jgi:hypothetical protein
MDFSERYNDGHDRTNGNPAKPRNRTLEAIIFFLIQGTEGLGREDINAPFRLGGFTVHIIRGVDRVKPHKENGMDCRGNGRENDNRHSINAPPLQSTGKNI